MYLNDLKFWSNKILFREHEKGFFSSTNLGTPQPVRLKNGQNADVSHANHMLTRFFQSTFWLL